MKNAKTAKQRDSSPLQSEKKIPTVIYKGDQKVSLLVCRK